MELLQLTRDKTYRNRILEAKQCVIRTERGIDRAVHEFLYSVEYQSKRKVKAVNLYSGKDAARIELLDDGPTPADRVFLYTTVDPKSKNRLVTNLLLNQATGELTWQEVLKDGSLGPVEKATLRKKPTDWKSRLGDKIGQTVGWLFFFPFGWFYLANKEQIDSIGKSLASLRDAAYDSYGEN